ncbi:General transcription factor IIH subunit 3 [Eumeta japonica]|uniref:General transcription factor IIH subunit 3 n=1 Tax=Eumeta variegata TaxID=151549 RepID=A0A4C1YWI0_EUMVA|nr:General transcription factor IIH subunit 3 [Eumeta japonica]
MADEEAPVDSSLLIIIVDTNPNQRYITDDPKVLTNCLDAIIAFANSHLMQKQRNQLAVIGCHFHKSEYLYPSPSKPLDVRQIDGQYELFTLVEKTIKMRLVNLIKSQPQDEKAGESLLAGSIAMALCYIARMRLQLSPGLSMSSRILIITGSGDTAAQYINYMNVFFTAQKQQVLIDVCSLDKHLSLLQQGCDITGGLYLKVPSLDGLLQYLLWVFLPAANERGKLVLPGRGRVDYRAACFCHRELVTIGYVCSVCLSEVHGPQGAPGGTGVAAALTRARQTGGVGATGLEFIGSGGSIGRAGDAVRSRETLRASDSVMVDSSNRRARRGQGADMKVYPNAIEANIVQYGLTQLDEETEHPHSTAADIHSTADRTTKQTLFTYERQIVDLYHLSKCRMENGISAKAFATESAVFLEIKRESNVGQVRFKWRYLIS